MYLPVIATNVVMSPCSLLTQSFSVVTCHQYKIARWWVMNLSNFHPPCLVYINFLILLLTLLTLLFLFQLPSFAPPHPFSSISCASHLLCTLYVLSSKKPSPALSLPSHTSSFSSSLLHYVFQNLLFPSYPQSSSVPWSIQLCVTNLIWYSTLAMCSWCCHMTMFK